MEKNGLELSRQLTQQGLIDMLAHLLLLPELYRAYSESILAEHFKPDELAFAYVWCGMKAYYTEQGMKTVPDRNTLELYVRDYMLKAPKPDEDLEDFIFGEDPSGCIIAHIYSIEASEVKYETGLRLVKLFIAERAIYNEVIKHVNDTKKFLGYVDLNEASKLRELADKAERLSSISTIVDIEDLAPDLNYFDKAKIQQKVPSGIWWIDCHINDGQRYGDVNGIIGPTGAGKTTLGSQLFVSNVREAIAQNLSGQDNRVCVFYTYEQRAFDLQQKVFSNAFSIARSSISEDKRLSESFSNGTTIPLKPYEIGNFNNLSEYERYNNERLLFSQHGIIRNMSGVADICDDERQINLKKNKGTGGLQELVNDLHYIQDVRKQGIRAVFIDYIGLVMERQYSVTSDSDVLYRALKRFPDEVRQKVAGEFNCVVWLLHQMSGTANKTRPTTPLHHADAEGCRSLANNMSNCLCLGNPDNGQESGGGKCLYLSFSKLRNSGASGFDSVNLILQHNSIFSRLDNVTSFYRPDKSQGCFFPVEEKVF